MKESTPPKRREPTPIVREEFEQFLQALTHEIRNRLSGISLEAADLAEQAGTQVDASRLQQQVQDCSAFLRKVRELATPEAADAEWVALAEVTKRLKERSL
jgi:signal transduction histidine kinase